MVFPTVEHDVRHEQMRPEVCVDLASDHDERVKFRASGPHVIPAG